MHKVSHTRRGMCIVHGEDRVQYVSESFQNYQNGAVSNQLTEGGGHGRRNFKDANPQMSSLLVILFGVVKQFCSFWVWSETECKNPQNMVYNTIQHPPRTVRIYFTFCLGRGRGKGDQREGRGATVHKYGSFVHRGNSSQAGSKIPTMSECISSL